MADSTSGPKGPGQVRVNPALEQAKDAGSQAVGKAKEAIGAVSAAAGHAATAAGKKADELTASAGTGIKKLGDVISHQAPQEGVAGAAAQAVAGSMKRGGQYLEDAKLSGMTEDMAQMIRQNPMPAVLIAVGVGFFLGRALRS